MRNAAFISCSFEDRAAAHELEDHLDSVGLPAWLFTERLDGGVFPQEISEAILKAACVVVVLSPRSAVSEWVARELHFAQDNKVPIVPVVIEAFPPSATLNMYVNRLAHIDAKQGFREEVKSRIALNVREHFRRLNPVISVMNMKGGWGKLH